MSQAERKGLVNPEPALESENSDLRRYSFYLYEQEANDYSTHGAEVVPLGEKEDWQEVEVVRVRVSKEGTEIVGHGLYVALIVLILAVTFIAYILIRR